MTKRIAVAAIVFGLALMCVPDRGRRPDAPLDHAFEFCTCGPARFGHFGNAPLRTQERDERQEWV